MKYFATLLIFFGLLVALGSCLRPPVGPSPNPQPVSSASFATMDGLIDQMRNRWQTLDADCSPLAPFALVYLFMTTGAKEYLQNGYFDFGDAMADFIDKFAGRYSAAIDAWLAGASPSSISPPWSEAFRHAATNRSTVSQDLFLGFNAHINYDLAIIVYDMNWGLSEKPDYDRVNDLLTDVTDRAIVEIANRYDPSFKPGGANGSPTVQAVLAEVLLTWRDTAWVNGQLLRTTHGSALTFATLVTVAATAATPYKLPLNTQQQASARLQYCEDNHSQLNV